MSDEFDLSGLSNEDRDLIISKLAPSLMGGQKPEDEHSACAETFKIYQETILMLAQAMDEMAEKLGVIDSFKAVIDTLMNLSNEQIKAQEMAEMKEKLGSIYSPFSEKYATISQGGNLEELLYKAIKELQKRSDYNDDMPSAFVTDKMGEFQKMLDALNAPAGEAVKPEGAVSVEKTTVAPKAEKGADVTVPEAKEAVPEATPEEKPDAYGLTPSKLKELEERAKKARAMAKGKKKE